MSGERDLIVELSRIFGRAPRQVLCGIGDDTAVFSPEEGYNLLWTIDSLIEGVHFDLRYTSLRLLGRKALAVNLSDIAAMGGEPQYALLALGWPPERDLQEALKLARGMQEIGPGARHSNDWRRYSRLTARFDAESDGPGPGQTETNCCVGTRLRLEI